jgi:hypothetical protein
MFAANFRSELAKSLGLPGIQSLNPDRGVSGGETQTKEKKKKTIATSGSVAAIKAVRRGSSSLQTQGHELVPHAATRLAKGILFSGHEHTRTCAQSRL